MTDFAFCDGFQVTVVINPGDDVIAVQRLNAVRGQGRAVVRPTPGGTAEDLALDMLAAMGHQIHQRDGRYCCLQARGGQPGDP